MRLRTIAELATIIGVAIAVLGYLKIQPNVLDEIPELYHEQAISDLKKTELSIEHNDTIGENAKVYNQYRTALAIKSEYSQDDALISVVKSALKQKSFKYAILGAKSINSQYTRDEQLDLIVDMALAETTSAGNAIIAAELIDSRYSKDKALEKILRFYQEGTSSVKQSRELSDIDKYKEVYNFADASAHMGMSSDEAKKFADDWFSKRPYEDFFYFKKVFTFADATAHMGMDENEAKEFALHWINNYSEVEFEIFQQAFKFADSTAGMSMSEQDAKVFAFRKVEEQRKKIDSSNDVNVTN
jgi:hypothetical protein